MPLAALPWAKLKWFSLLLECLSVFIFLLVKVWPKFFCFDLTVELTRVSSEGDVMMVCHRCQA